jgi:hypothetical protein
MITTADLVILKKIHSCSAYNLLVEYSYVPMHFKCEIRLIFPVEFQEMNHGLFFHECKYPLHRLGQYNATG